MNLVCIIDSEVLGNDDDIVVTQCGHVFHKNCISEWLISSRTCPSCRSPSSTTSLIKLFLENDDNKVNELHNELLKSNEKLTKELTELREKANKQEGELIDLRIKHREMGEKVKTLERKKQIDDMMLISLRGIKDDSTKEILKLNRQMMTLKLDLLAERELRRRHQTTLHTLDPENENYDPKNVVLPTIPEDNCSVPVGEASSLPPWVVLNSSTDGTSETNDCAPSVKKDQVYVIPAKIQKSNGANDRYKPRHQAKSPVSYNFNYRRLMQENEPPRFPFSNNSVMAAATSPANIDNSYMPESTEDSRNKFSFNFNNNPATFSSLFQFGNTQSNAESSNEAGPSNQTPFRSYRDNCKTNSINSPRSSDR